MPSPASDPARIRGRLITTTFAATGLAAVRGAQPPPPEVVRRLDAWWDTCDTTAGPASSVRTVAEVVTLPLLRILGFTATARRGSDPFVLDAVARGVVLPVIVTPWAGSLDRVWRTLVLDGVRLDARWCVCCNGTALRIVDVTRTWSRHYLEIDLASLPSSTATQVVLWSVLRAESLALRPATLDLAAESSARQGITLCAALGRGVLTALGAIADALAARSRVMPDRVLFEQSLVVVYRVLFLLFAEARGLVPMWHAVYRERYSIDAIVTALLDGRECRGIWAAVQAISRLAHAGCIAGDLRVTAFNGRLFSPVASPAFDRVRVADEPLRQAILAVGTTAPARGGRERIAYRDLDVEQLGAVYEQVLDHEPSTGAAGHRHGDARKASASFYTPRPLTSWLVRHTLEPLVHGRTAAQILALRVLDPAMGSGAFLVAACRYLAASAEEALVREGTWHPGDVNAADRAGLRRRIAQQCLFGVDLNPMAVQLARLSLWLTTLASDRPLTFLDHRLIAGDSLVGATPDDVRRQAPGSGSGRRPDRLPLFESSEGAVLEHAVQVRLQLAMGPDDTPADVRDKERILAALDRTDTPLGRWRQIMSLWCATWFWDGSPPPANLFAALCDAVLGRESGAPERLTRPWIERGAEIAGRHAFVHWPLSFPEVFADQRGDPHSNPGFDAIVGNPPWDMVRGDSGGADVRAARRVDATRLAAFARGAGIYRVETRSHVNRYQLFLERALQLVRRGGRIGMVLPGGFLSDSGAAGLRRHLLDRAGLDTVAGFENRRGIFPVHRSVRFVLLTCTAGHPTSVFRCRFGLTTADDLDRDTPPRLSVSRRLLARISGEDDLGVPELASARDLAIVERISATAPWLSAPLGWGAQFGRELNATDDRARFTRYSAGPTVRPVLEGKQIEPFRVSLDTCRYELKPAMTGRTLPFRDRLAYRDVASATNRLTLIAAIVPARAVTVHTLFCLKSPLPHDAQLVLCGLLNSLVANYLIRLRVSTHVTVALVSRLPVPVLDPADPLFARILSLVRALGAGTVAAEQMPEYAELQALAAHLYRLDHDDFVHVLGRFPLLEEEMKVRTLRLFDKLR